MIGTTYVVTVLSQDGRVIMTKKFEDELNAKKEVERVKNILKKHKAEHKYEVLQYPEIRVA